MKKFHLFAWFLYYPNGGGIDFVGSFATLEEAQNNLPWKNEESGDRQACIMQENSDGDLKILTKCFHPSGSRLEVKWENGTNDAEN